jgi:hypothetical protein
MARRSLITSCGGCTCKIPAFIVHGPNPLTFARSRTAIVKSWCQTTFQFELRVLLNKIPRTAKHSGPSTASTISRTGRDIASVRTLGTDKRFLSGWRVSSNCLLRCSTVASSKHAGTTAKPSCSTRFLNAVVVSALFKIAYPVFYRKNGMTNSLKQTQVAIATKNPNTQKSAIVEALYGLLGNKSGGGFNAFSFAISNATWSSSALMRLLRSTSLCQSVFTVKSPHTILVPGQLLISTDCV